ncbi:MAG TPA: adenosyl-hopene transferase HpnH [Pirellulales bacterium]
MGFPLALTKKMALYMLGKKLRGEKRYPLVLMLEPLHACNLTCTGCGRIREYAKTIKDKLTLQECLDSADECGAPIVSICGGEPMIYPEIEELCAKLMERGKHIYLCTNGMFIKKKIKGFKPSNKFFFNIHLDGMQKNHDLAVEREGVFEAAIEGVKIAKAAGFLVCSNTTIYRETDMNEIGELYTYLQTLGVDTFMLSPAYGYQAVWETNKNGAQEIFLTRDEIKRKFKEAQPILKKFKLGASPVYLEFLRGERDLDCAAWANPTRNIRGWKGPCYLITDGHYKTYRELVEQTDWSALGRGKDPRCEHCMVHCGFEPAAALGHNGKRGDLMKMALWQLT